jgi:hypothetical protein
MSPRWWVVVVTEPDGTKITYGPLIQSDAEWFAADMTGPESDGTVEAEPMMLRAVDRR